MFGFDFVKKVLGFKDKNQERLATMKPGGRSGKVTLRERKKASPRGYWWRPTLAERGPDGKLQFGKAIFISMGRT